MAIAPGDMELFENKLITEAMLRGLSLHELRLLRNEIYARHGRIFKTIWIQQYFGGQIWYDPKEDFKDEEIPGIDKTNIETIVALRKQTAQFDQHQADHRALLHGIVRRGRAQDARRDLRASRQSLQRPVDAEVFRQLRLVQGQSQLQRRVIDAPSRKGTSWSSQLTKRKP